MSHCSSFSRLKTQNEKKLICDKDHLLVLDLCTVHLRDFSWQIPCLRLFGCIKFNCYNEICSCHEKVLATIDDLRSEITLIWVDLLLLWVDYFNFHWWGKGRSNVVVLIELVFIAKELKSEIIHLLAWVFKASSF
jgi:hypothetical protein